MPHRDLEIVIKVGGALLAHRPRFDAVMAEIGAAARERAILVVPGGGPFADAVREVDRQIHLADDTAHWMAVLAMDQYAHVIAERLMGGQIVDAPRTIAAALAAGRVPVLAPFRWLREADPLPHSWEVTSDSIAAWIAGALGARCVVLVKPGGRKPEGLLYADVVDSYFRQTLPDGVASVIAGADQIDVLRAALRRT